MSISADVLDLVEAKMKTVKYNGTDTILDTNVFVGETIKDFADAKYFPRLEIQMHADDSTKYISQFHLDNIKVFSVSGWLKYEDSNRDLDNPTYAKQKLVEILNFFDNTMLAITSINTDKYEGLMPIPWFERVSPEIKSEIYHEMYDKMSSFVILFGIELLKDWRK